jgi:hypothetical protein
MEYHCDDAKKNGEDASNFRNFARYKPLLNIHYTKLDFIQFSFSGILSFYMFSSSSVQWPTTSMQVLNHQPSNHQNALFHTHVRVLHNARTNGNYYYLITFHTLQQTNTLGKLIHSILSPTQPDYEGTKPKGIKKPTQINLRHTTTTLMRVIPHHQTSSWILNF